MPISDTAMAALTTAYRDVTEANWSESNRIESKDRVAQFQEETPAREGAATLGV